MMKNGIHFIVTVFMVAKLFKILIYTNCRTFDIKRWTQNEVKENVEYL